MMWLFLPLLGILGIVHGALWTPWNPTDRANQSTTFFPVVRKTVRGTSDTPTVEPERSSQEELKILGQLAGKLCDDKEKCLQIFIDSLNERQPKYDLGALLNYNRSYRNRIRIEKENREFMKKVRQSKEKIFETSKVLWRKIKEKLETSEIAKKTLIFYTHKYLDYFIDVLIRLPTLYEGNFIVYLVDMTSRMPRLSNEEFNGVRGLERGAIALVFENIFGVIRSALDSEIPFEEEDVQNNIDYNIRMWCDPGSLMNTTQPPIC